MQALQTGLWSKSGPLATRARNPWRGHLKNRHGREYPMSDQRGKVLSFGPFELSIGNMLLANGAKIVPLGARAMDLLIVLVEQANKVVDRRTLIERVWPKRGAEQVSLRVHISPLRKALDQSDPGRRYIANVPGRECSFVVPVTSLSSPTSGDLNPSSRSRLPARLMRMLGRRDALAKSSGRAKA
jgi:DNA-binding winged helix-turn-helix (wHTH) protein